MMSDWGFTHSIATEVAEFVGRRLTEAAAVSPFALGSVRTAVTFLLVVTTVFAAGGIYVTRYAQESQSAASTQVEKSFKRSYVVAYLLAMLSDWLQGPYVYALYAAYGFSHAQNGYLFIFGFGSSMLFGTVIGGYADKFGRKKFAILYCLIYAASCCTKHFNNFFMLSIGRILAGVATSLLYSVFESWLVCEHSQRGFSDDLLGDTFSLAIFGNSIVAICAGFIAQFVSDLMPFYEVSDGFWIGRYCTPFDVAVGVLFGCAYFIQTVWCENYGSSSFTSVNEDNADSAGGGSGNSSDNDFQKAWGILQTSKPVRSLGLMAGFFESSMFLFVFLWTPAINAVADSPPYGLIFALFMLGCMCGSCCYSILTVNLNWGIIKVAYLIFGVSTVAHCMVIFSTSPFLLLVAFVAFEICVGMYFPVMGIMKSKIVPESCRSTMYNFFRVPLNFIVCMVLLTNVSVKLGFLLTTTILGINLYLLAQVGELSENEGKVGSNMEMKGIGRDLEEGELGEGYPVVGEHGMGG